MAYCFFAITDWLFPNTSLTRSFPSPWNRSSTAGPNASPKLESLVVTLMSVSRDRENWFCLTEQGWIAASNPETGTSPPEPEKGTLFEYPEASSLLSLLKQFDLEEAEYGEWLKPIKSDFPTLFYDWIQSLPKELQVIADDDLVESKPASRYALHRNRRPTGLVRCSA